MFLGIDGGGTQTRAALADQTGTVLGTGHAGPSNYQAVGIDMARMNIREAVERAWENAGRTMEPCEAAFLGMAGVASEKDRERIMAVARELDLARMIDVDHDIRTALAGGLEGGPGIALIAGTGSSCYGRTADGRSWRAGGWGHLLDDVGSGYWLGLRGLMAIAHATDGRGPGTSLVSLLTVILQLDDMNDLLHVAGSLTRAEIAELAPVVLQSAHEGDRVATEIVTEGATELARMAAAVAHNLGMEAPVSIVLIGGLMENADYVKQIRSALAIHLPHGIIVEGKFSPVIGATILARNMKAEV